MKRRFVVLLTLVLAGCATSYFRLSSSEGSTPGLERTCRDKYWEFKAGTVTIMLTSSEEQQFAVILWINPSYAPRLYEKDPHTPIPVRISANLSGAQLKEISAAYRPTSITKSTRTPGILVDDWKTETIPDGQISTVGMYKIYFSRDAQSLGNVVLYIPEILVDGKAYTFSPVTFERTAIVKTGLVPCG